MRLTVPPLLSIGRKHRHESVVREDWAKEHLKLNDSIVIVSPSGIDGLSYAGKTLGSRMIPVLDSWLHPIVGDHSKINLQETSLVNGEISHV